MGDQHGPAEARGDCRGGVADMDHERAAADRGAVDPIRGEAEIMRDRHWRLAGGRDAVDVRGPHSGSRSTHRARISSARVNCFTNRHCREWMPLTAETPNGLSALSMNIRSSSRDAASVELAGRQGRWGTSSGRLTRLFVHPAQGTHLHRKRRWAGEQGKSDAGGPVQPQGEHCRPIDREQAQRPEPLLRPAGRD